MFSRSFDLHPWLLRQPIEHLFETFSTPAPCEGPWADPYAFPATSADCVREDGQGQNTLFQPDNGALGQKINTETETQTIGAIILV